MAKSGARKDAAQVRPSATSPPLQHSPGATASSFASRSPQLLFYPGAPTRSSASPSTPPHLYPPLMESSSANPTWYKISALIQSLAITISVARVCSIM
ncbi:unnamed protein product [Triticum turgidum subsp. durum]|uniref:Uncharacterized protein n=1 Tax=Triticum turgidum subsp. durum TaxID=4567 RepID=A0A9R1C493_TRITD|nr:unnamed protein product [Triticum turgidum subsp. durum]